MLIGADLTTSAAPGADPVGDARLCEELGFDFVSASDHPISTEPNFETWTMLTFVAARTTRVTLMTRVLAAPFRSPVLVAKMAESLDRLSGGRLVLGLGAGYLDAEFAALGVAERSPREKIDGLGEAIAIIRAAWRGERFDYAGRHSGVVGAQLTPAAARPIPIWLGSYGPRALSLTGAVADGWIPSLGFLPKDQLAPRRAAVVAAAAEAGRDESALTCTLNVAVHVGGDVAASERILAGPAQAVADELQGFAALGYSGFNLIPVGADRREQLRRLGEQIVPRLRP